MKFKEFRMVDGILRPIYIELKTGKEKYLVSRIRKIKDKATKEEMEVLMGMDWKFFEDDLKPVPPHLTKELKYKLDTLWLERRLFEAERKLAKIEEILGKEKFETIIDKI